MKKNITCKIQNFCILLAFLLIVIPLLRAISIDCYLKKYIEKKNLPPFHATNNELKEIMY